MPKSLPAKKLCAIASCLAASGFLLTGAASTVAAQSARSVPDFYMDGGGWVTMSNDFFPPKSGLGPVRSDPKNPYVMESGNGQRQTFRVSDTSHPALMPWVKD